MKHMLFPCLFALLLSGCDALESPLDKSAKNALQGSWYVEFNDPSERLIKYAVNLDASGAFAARQRMEGEPREENSTGLWYVTDSLFKLQTNTIEGKKLGTLDSFYLTCKLGKIAAEVFSCEQGSKKVELKFRRVKSDFAFS